MTEYGGKGRKTAATAEVAVMTVFGGKAATSLNTAATA
jgi:hypothetical protein